MHVFLRTRRKITSSSALPLDQPNSSVSVIANDHESLLLSSVDQLIRRGLLSTAQQLIKRIIANSSSLSDAVSVFEFADVRGVELDLGSYGVLIRKLVSSGQHQLAEHIYRECICRREVDPDPSMLNSMVLCFSKLGKLETAIIHLDRIFLMNSVPCTAACNTLLRELCSQGMILEAFDCFVRISDAGLFLGFWSFNVLIDGLCNRGYMDEALQMYDIMSNRNGCLPTVHLYKTLFYGLCKRGQVLEAELLFMEMESKGLYIDKVMYTTLINGYCKNKKMEMAMRVFLRMLKTGCEPDICTCNTLIQGYMKLHLYDKGRAIFKQMTEWGMQPDVSTYGIMINENCKKGKIDYALNRLSEVDELLKSMMDGGVVPDHVLFLILAKKFPKDHLLQLALMILQAIAKNGCGFDLSRLSYSASLSPSRDQEQEIHILLEEISRRNLNLAVVAFSVCINALTMGGKIEIALICLDRMLNLGCRPSLFTYNSLIKCLCQEGLFEDAKSLIDFMKSQGIVPDHATYLIMINEYCKRGCLSRKKRILEAEDNFKKMLEAGVDPDEVVYLTMINGYLKNGRAVEAHRLFDNMVENSIRQV
ncbi:hypothetical protein FNV43_RR04446 [Rhamnella rubrinervis]|uniref:Pentatricopeptide repeat-containing protein n=1 Tax=Rhamnella rubrinervis TaxID=2594499 RepID=A0A8K0HLY3_9ROSA|nr:hypothetical protein FNV43_RR04446 [Rhamnella rubrinervis]